MNKDFLAQDEGKNLEFKENAQSLRGIVKTIVAFANTAGGTIVIGIRDKTKEIVGIANVLKEEERLANAIAESIAPSIMPDIEIRSIRKKEIILLHVYHAIGPYFLKLSGLEKGTYLRLGSTNRVADAQALQRLQLFAKNISPDELPYHQGSKKSLDWKAIDSEFKKVNKTLSEHKSQTLGLLAKEHSKLYPTTGGILLFGKDKELIFPDSVIQCAQFAGNDKVTFVDQKDIQAYIPDAIEMVISFIETHTKTGAVIGRKRRVDVPEYPPVAIREAVINAILHADYTMIGSSISVAIFSDRIEITNPGGLHFGMTLDSALAGSSRLRNRAIGRVLRELKLIERWGSGIKRIQDACNKQGLKQPLFQELGNQFRVTIFSTPSVEKTQLQSVTKMHHWEAVMIEYLRKNKEVSTKKAADLWSVTSRTARHRLKQMVNDNLLYKIATSPKDPRAVFVLRK